jgi:hypothetical protein
MNMDSVNKWLTLAANLGVIAGIIFLGIEIGQNSDQLAAQTRSTMFEARVSLENDSARNTGGITDIVGKARRGEALTETEESQLGSRRFRTLRTFEFIIQESPPETAYLQGPYMAAVFRSDSGLIELWNFTSDGGGFDPVFVQFMNEIVIPRLNQ